MVNMQGVYEAILGVFVAPITDNINNIATNLNALTHFTTIVGLVTALVFIFWAWARFKDGDLYQMKTYLDLTQLILILGFINYGVNNPTEVMGMIKSIIFTPSQIVSEWLEIGGKNIAQDSGSGAGNLAMGRVIEGTLRGLVLVWDSISANFDFNIFSIGKTIFLSFLGIIIVIGQVLILITMLLIILLSSIEVFVWLSLGILFIPLLMFRGTMSMFFSYFKKLIGLSMYPPLLLVLGTLHYKVIDVMVRNMPNSQELQSGIMGEVQDFLGASAFQGLTTTYVLVLIIVITFISLYLIRRVPEVINAIIGTHTGDGLRGSMKMVQQAGQGLAQGIGGLMGGTAGGIVSTAKNASKSAYENAGGGLGGLIAGAGAFITAGLSNAVGGAKLGNAINQGIEKGKSGAGKGINNLIDRFASVGSKKTKV